MEEEELVCVVIELNLVVQVGFLLIWEETERERRGISKSQRE